MPSRLGSALVMSGASEAEAIFDRSRSKLHVRRRVAEGVVGDQRAIGLAAQRAELALVDRLEQGALVPARAGIVLEVAIKLALADVQDADLERRVGLGIEDEIREAAPSALQLLELGRVQHLVHLRRQFLVEAGDHLLDRVEHFALDDGRIRERLGDESLHRILDFACGALAFAA